jgi:hypothetical protein
MGNDFMLPLPNAHFQDNPCSIRDLLPRTRPTVRSITPGTWPRVTLNAQPGSVKHRSRFTGTVHPPTAAVQVLVYSHDDLWYLQADAGPIDGHVDVTDWTCEVCCGVPDVPTGRLYFVVAVTGARITTPTLSPSDYLPVGAVLSDVIAVTRA